MRYLHCAAFLLSLVLSSRASAQGTAPQLPDPISTIGLHRLLDGVIADDDPRWEAIEAKHDAYLAKFAVLRKERIAKLLPQFRAGDPDGPQVVAEGRRIAATIATMERALFDGVGELLGDAGAAGVQRAASHRERQRLRSTVGYMNGVHFEPLGAIDETARGAINDPKELALIDPLLAAYEARVTPLLRNAVTKELDASERGLRAAIDAKIDPVARHQDRTLGQRWSELFQEGRGEKVAEAERLRTEIDDLDRKTRLAILAPLSFESRRRARTRLDLRPSVRLYWSGTALYLEGRYYTALMHGDLSDDKKAEVRAEYERWAHDDEKIVDELFRLDPRSRTDQKRVNDLLTERNVIADAASKHLIDRVVPELRGRLISVGVGKDASEIDPFDDDVREVSPDSYDHDARWKPRPISKERMLELSDRLAIPAATQATVVSIVEDATTRRRTALRESAQRVWSADAALRPAGGAEVVGPDSPLIRAVAQARIAFLDDVARFDDATYEDFVAVLDPKPSAEARAEIELSQLSRAFERFGTGDWAMYLANNVVVRPVDPVAIIDRLKLDSEARAIVRRALLERRVELLAAARQRAEVQAALCDTLQAASNEQQAAQRAAQLAAPGAAPDEAVLAEMRKKFYAEVSRRREMAAQRLAGDRAIRALFTEAIATLDEPTRRAAELAYERKAVPEFFADSRSPWGLLERAAHLDTLNEATQQAIAALRVNVESAHARAAVAFADHRRMGTPPAPEAASWYEVEDVHRAEEAVFVFERDERSARAVATLRRLLTPEQRALVPGLDDYEWRGGTVRRQFIRFAD